MVISAWMQIVREPFLCNSLLAHGKKTHLFTIGSKSRMLRRADESEQRRNEGLPTMQCGSLLFKITIFDERMLESC